MGSLADKPGRGRKECPSCHKYPGVRSKTCPGCGHVFVSKPAKKVEGKVLVKVKTKSEPKEAAETETLSMGGVTLRPGEFAVTTPRGKCPVQLESTEREAVEVWMKEVREAYSEGALTSEALSYWARTMYPYFVLQENGDIVSSDIPDRLTKMISEIDSNA